MENTQKGFFSLPLVLVVLAVVAVILAGYLVVKNGKVESLPADVQVENRDEEKVACTMDAKMCPDGSYVGRVAPNCEFAKCPTLFATEPYDMTASLNQKIFLGAEVYVTPLKVLSDSRCPVDVTCIQAGDVTLKVRLEKDGSSKEMEIKEGGSGVDFGPMIISLVSVSPEANSKKQILEKDYKFTFKVDWKLD